MRAVYFLAATAACAVVGLFGAGAFNPDDGWVTRSYTLYKLFGVSGELALIATPVVAIACLAALLWSARRE